MFLINFGVTDKQVIMDFLFYFKNSLNFWKGLSDKHEGGNMYMQLLEVGAIHVNIRCSCDHVISQMEHCLNNVSDKTRVKWKTSSEELTRGKPLCPNINVSINELPFKRAKGFIYHYYFFPFKGNCFNWWMSFCGIEHFVVRLLTLNVKLQMHQQNILDHPQILGNILQLKHGHRPLLVLCKA